MRVFGINQDGKFREFLETAFDLGHQEAVLEEWLEANPDGFLDDDKVLVIGRQVTTNLGGFVDLLGLDRDGNVVVVELKRDRTPRDTLGDATQIRNTHTTPLFLDWTMAAKSWFLAISSEDQPLMMPKQHQGDWLSLASDDAVLQPAVTASWASVLGMNSGWNPASTKLLATTTIGRICSHRDQ